MKDKQNREDFYLDHKTRYNADINSTKNHNSELFVSKNNTINKLTSNIDRLSNEKDININTLQNLGNIRSDLISRITVLNTELNSTNYDFNN